MFESSSDIRDQNIQSDSNVKMASLIEMESAPKNQPCSSLRPAEKNNSVNNTPPTYNQAMNLNPGPLNCQNRSYLQLQNVQNRHLNPVSENSSHSIETLV